MAPLWYYGVCDDLLAKLNAWNKNYHKGMIHSEKDWRDFDGSVKKVVVKRIHRLSFSLPELDHLIRILNGMPNGKEIAMEISNLKDTTWSKGTLLRQGQRMLELAFYPEHVALMAKLVYDCKNAPKTQVVEKAIEESKTGGKDLFEV